MTPPPVGLATRIACQVLSVTNTLLAFAARLTWRGRAPESPTRICVWRTGNIGDLVCALPALAAIRRTWPSAEMTLLTSPGVKGAPGALELLEDASWIDQLWVYYPREISGRRFAKEIREHDFDLVLRLPQNMTTPWREMRDLVFLKLFARVSFARGFAVGSLRWLGLGAARALSKAPNIQHESDRQVRLLGSTCVTAKSAEFPLPLNAEIKAESDRLFDSHALVGASILCLSPGAKRETNRWPVERFAEIAKRWIEMGGRVVVIGGPGEHELGSCIADRSGPQTVNLCGKSTLLLASEILRRSQLLVSGDTGTIHLAAAVGTPCVVPFSARDVPKRWFPYTNASTPAASRSIVHRQNPACSPCWLETCPNENRCLAEIDVDQIWESAMVIRQRVEGAQSPPAIAI